MRKYLLFLLLATTLEVTAQQNLYETDFLSPEFHAGRREALRNILPNNSVAIIFASPNRNRANDVDFEYHQDPNFYYLTGLQEPNSVLLIFKNPTKINSSFETNEIILVQKRDTKAETWTGRRLGLEGVKKLGFQHVYINATFPELDIDFSKINTILSLKWHNDVRDDEQDRGDLHSLYSHFIKKIPKNQTINDTSLNELLAGLREIKQPEELIQIKKAIEITCNAHLELMKNLKNMKTEYEAEALIEYHFKKNGAEHPAFPSIVGNAENSCILHYVTNRKILEDKTLLVVDIGAEYHNYSADVTRTLPIGGKFTEEQKIIYEVVLEARNRALKSCKKKEYFFQPHKDAAAYIKEQLYKLKIVNDTTDFRRYFTHGTSHYLGLDVHDAGLYGKLKPNTVITVEPGIYIPEGSPCDKKWWNIGIRIEDDILITENEPIVLSNSVPVKIDEIEKLMK